MDDLVQRLNQLRPDRQESNRQHQLALEQSNTKECSLLAAIREESNRNKKRNDRNTNDAQFQGNIQNNRENPLEEGDKVRITNHHVADKYGVTSKVTHVCKKMVDVRNQSTGKRYCRAWWNLERVDDHENT